MKTCHCSRAVFFFANILCQCSGTIGKLSTTLASQLKLLPRSAQGSAGSARSGSGMVSAGSGKPGKGGKAARDPIQEAKEAQLAQEAEVCTVYGTQWALAAFLHELMQTWRQAACLAGCPWIALHDTQHHSQQVLGGRRHSCASAGCGQNVESKAAACTAWGSFAVMSGRGQTEGLLHLRRSEPTCRA